MSSYKKFAEYYDTLMKEDIDYSKIADFIENIFTEYDLAPELVADLACGTGNVTIPMAQRGYDMIGVDNSVEMLNTAREKASKENTNILFLNQSISKLDLYGTCDAFLCMIDGINYILSPTALFNLFKRVKTCFLNPGGIFIFDISSYYKLSETIGNNTFIYDKEDIFYSWENKFHKEKSLSEMYLNFFVKGKNGYKRFCERHLQRAYKTEEIEKIIKKAGYTDIKFYDGFSFNEANEKSPRIVMVAK